MRSLLLGCVLLCGCGGAETGGPAKDAVALKVFKATMPDEARRFTLTAELSSFYNGDYYGEQDTYYAVRMEAAGDDGVTEGVLAYARKTSAVGKRVFAALKDGKKHRLTVRLRYASRRSAGTAEIASLD